jgi:hypothetical protein
MDDTVNGMEGIHRLSGGLALHAVDSSAALAQALRRELGDPVPTEPGSSAPLEVSAAAEARPTFEESSGDAGDGRVVGRRGDRVVVSAASGWFSVGPGQHGLTIEAAPRTRAWSLVRGVVRPLLQRSRLPDGVVVVHASAVRVGDLGVLVGGWSESGKTEVSLALAERDARFVGDKWTIVFPEPDAELMPASRGPDRGGSTIAAYPMSVGIREWVVPFLPRLAGTIGAGSRARLAAGRVAATMGRSVARAGNAHPATELILSPFGKAGELTATLRMPATAVRQVYRQDDPIDSTALNVAIMLTTVPRGTAPSIAELSPAVAADRLARSAAFERRDLHLLGERARLHFPGTAPIPGFEGVADEVSAIAKRLEGVATFEVRTPFPADPGPAADLILSVL